MNKHLKEMDFQDLVDSGSWKVIQKITKGNLHDAVADVIHLTMAWMREKKGAAAPMELASLSLGVDSEGKALNVHGTPDAVNRLREILSRSEQLESKVNGLLQDAKKAVSWLDWSGGLPQIAGECMTTDLQSLRNSIQLYNESRLPKDAVSYVLMVPDKCDRIVWRGSYYNLPLKQTMGVQESLEEPGVNEGIQNT